MTEMTGLFDCEGKEIKCGDMVSLDGNMTADNSMGSLPNGWIFDDKSVYKVYYDDRISNWSLDLGVDPDTPVNRKFMDHAVGLLHQGASRIVNKISG